MKSTKKKRVIVFILLLAMTASGFLSACGEDEDTITIGIIQFASHPSLDNCYEGIKKGLEASGLKYKLDFQIGNADPATCDTLATNMVAKNYDIIIAIATPAAISAYSAAENSSTAVIFCAVSDPQAAGLVDNPNAPGGNCTGTSDQLDLKGQLEMIRAFQPDAKRIGVMYTTSEANSVSHLQQFKALASQYGFTVVEQGVQSAADIPAAAVALAAGSDCINNFTDNNVVSNLEKVLEKTNEAKIPVYGSEVEQVKKGCLASMSIDYVKLGEKTAEMAVQVLNGTDPGTIPVSFVTDSTPVVNPEAAALFGIEIPQAYSDAEKVN